MPKSALGLGVVLFCFLIAFLEAAIPSSTSSAGDSSDTITLTSGQVLKGKIINQNNDQVVILFDYGTLVVSPSKIRSIQRPPAQATTESIPAPKPYSFPAWRDIVQKLTKTYWATRYQQIPATVIDTGVLADVPYISFRINDDYELNIYGDPDDPAGVELGVYHGLVNDDGARNNCMTFIAGIFPDADLKLTFDKLKRDAADKIESGLLTFETTLPSAPDSYGGWWITVYKTKALAQARASKKELESITVARTGQGDNSLTNPLAWTASDIRLSRPVATYQPQVTTPPETTSSSYYSTPSASSYNSTYSSGTGRVYVKGYFRKDGTYVHPHTRSRPSK